MKNKISLNGHMSKANEQDREDIFKVWQKCFGDPKEYIELCIKANLHHFFVYKSEGKVVSMLCVIPCMYGSARGGYVYAVATHPNYQGKGFSKQLLAYAEIQMEKEGYDFSCLVPASERLFSFYSSQGYQTALYCSKYNQVFEQTIKDIPKIEVQKIGVEQFVRLKEDLQQPNHIKWSKEHLEFLYKENNFLGGQVLEINISGEQGIAVIAIGEDAVFIKDIISCSQIENFARYISQKYHKDCFVRAQPTINNKHAFGMVKHFKGNNKISDGYISLVLD